MMADERGEQQFEGQVEQVAAIRQAVGAAVGALGGSDEDIFACQLAADEAATNAFVHGYGGAPGRVALRIWREGDDLCLQLREWGRPFDQAALAPAPAPPHPLRSAGGRGLLLMRAVMDEVRFDQSAQAGKTVTLRRRLRPPAPPTTG